MKNTWAKFIFIKTPIAMMLVSGLFELSAHFLKGTPLRRHDLDNLASAINQIKLDAPIVVLGDSVTQDTLKRHDPLPGKLANLTTNKATGLVGGLFLLKRYLDKNENPKHLVIASTPEFLTYTPEGKSSELFLTSVFNKPEEINWMREKNPSIPIPRRRLAVLDFENTVFYPLLNLIINKPASFSVGSKIDPSIPLENVKITKNIQVDIIKRSQSKPTMTPEVKNVLFELCSLSQEHKFSISYVVAPLPKTVKQIWKKRGVLSWIKSDITSSMPPECQSIDLFDINEYTVFPDAAMRDSDHLRRPGWTNFYAIKLSEVFNKLLEDKNEN